MLFIPARRIKLETARGFRTELRVDPLWRAIKIFQESGAEPALHFQRGAVVPVPAELFTAPLELNLEAGKRLCGEDQGKTRFSVRDLLNQTIDDRIGAGHEWFLPQSHCRIIEDPQTSGFVRVNRDQLVDASAPFPRALSGLIRDEDLEPMIAQAISYPHLAHRPWIDRDPLASGLAIVTPQ